MSNLYILFKYKYIGDIYLMGIFDKKDPDKEYTEHKDFFGRTIREYGDGQSYRVEERTTLNCLREEHQTVLHNTSNGEQIVTNHERKDGFLGSEKPNDSYHDRGHQSADLLSASFEEKGYDSYYSGNSSTKKSASPNDSVSNNSYGASSSGGNSSGSGYSGGISYVNNKSSNYRRSSEDNSFKQLLSETFKNLLYGLCLILMLLTILIGTAPLFSIISVIKLIRVILKKNNLIRTKEVKLWAITSSISLGISAYVVNHVYESVSNLTDNTLPFVSLVMIIPILVLLIQGFTIVPDDEIWLISGFNFVHPNFRENISINSFFESIFIGKGIYFFFLRGTLSVIMRKLQQNKSFTLELFNPCVNYFNQLPSGPIMESVHKMTLPNKTVLTIKGTATFKTKYNINDLYLNNNIGRINPSFEANQIIDNALSNLFEEEYFIQKISSLYLKHKGGFYLHSKDLGINLEYDTNQCSVSGENLVQKLKKIGISLEKIDLQFYSEERRKEKVEQYIKKNYGQNENYLII